MNNNLFPNISGFLQEALIVIINNNMINKKAEKIWNYNLIIEIQRMWNVKAKVIPIIVGVTRTILKSLRQYLSNIPGNNEIKEQQKKQPYWALHTYFRKC